MTKLKIDKSFVRLTNLDVNSKKRVSSLSRGHGIATTAGGMAAEADSLGSIGCDFGQGGCYAKPMKAADLLRFLRAQVPAQAALADVGGAGIAPARLRKAA